MYSGFTLACGLSQTALQLIVFRGFQGVTISFCLTTAVGIISTSFPADQGQIRNTAFAVLGAGNPVSIFGSNAGFNINWWGQIPPQELEAFTAEALSTHLIRDFVKLLSHSPSIFILWITLDIRAWPVAQFVGEERRRLQKLADFKAAEIWLECGYWIL